LTCYKIHKEACQAFKPSSDSTNSGITSLSTELNSSADNLKEINEKRLITASPNLILSDTSGDLLQEEALMCLENSEKLKSLLANKHLRNLMIDLNQRGDVNVDKNMDKCMVEPLFQEFSETCLNLIKKK